MKNLTLKLLVFSLLVSCTSKIDNKGTNTNSSGPDKKHETEITKKKKISNPFNLQYDYHDQIKLEDGSAATAYIEKGKSKSANNTGDYLWSKAVPLYASNEVKYTFEYQMDFTDSDFNALKEWLIEIMGTDVKHASLDNPSWYNREMTLTEVYEYCKQNNKNITIAFLNKTKKYLTLVIIDSGSKKTNTSAEMAILFTVLNK
ncbi:MAG: hypothetical protein RBT49_18420 [Bacteroidales bacterium]|jgi:hypothetical protein|nr:hypothetical protein [Bacteroidales bacterium]